jgi:CelD/BcsL family acetyltransferase involved in cellulose biosynthesis
MADLVPAWQALVNESGADVQFSPEWLTAWWRQFGKGKQFSTIVVHSGNRMVGLLPFATGEVPTGLRRLRVARLAGPIPYFSVLQIPLLLECAEAAWRQLLVEDEAILGPALLDADVICLSQLSHGGEALQPLRTALKGLSAPLAMTCDETPAHTLIPLADSFEGYMSQLSRKRRTKYRKSKQVLESDGVETRCLAGPEAVSFLPEFISRHNAQWQSVGRQGHFGDWPQNAGFLADVLALMAAGQTGRFYVQRDAKGQFLAAQFCFVQGPTCLALLTARDKEAEQNDRGIGYYAQFERIARIIPEGARRIDSGVGEYDHKASLGADMQPLSRIMLYRARMQRQVSSLRRWSGLVDLVYYRLWFLKLAPALRRFGLARAPLWQYWVKTRL